MLYFDKKLLTMMLSVGLVLFIISSVTRSTLADISPRRVSLAGDVMAGKLRYRVEPIYPPEARRNNIQGTVKLRALIGVDGSVRQLTVDEGREPLVHAAIDAVKQWKYEPVLVSGELVEVVTSISVVFRLDGKK